MSVSNAVPPIKPPLITKTTKQNLLFQKSLAKLAATDAKHDFGLVYAVIDRIKSGLPKDTWPPTIGPIFFDESSSLTSVLIQPDPKKSQTLQEMIPDEKATTPCTISIKNPNNDQPLHKYYGRKRYIKKAKEFNNGLPFVTDCDLNGSVLVVDFNQNGFLEMLTKGDKSANTTLYYVMIPELLNDPAGKTPLDDNIFSAFNKPIGTGIQLVPLLETTNKTVVYNAYDSNDDTPSNNFMSTYNLQLSPIIHTKQISGKTTTSHVTLNIFSTTGEIRHAEVKNCKKENSIKSLLKFLTSLFSKTTADSNFNYSAKLQQKRSGDWLQVLACLDIYNRTFEKFTDKTPQVLTASSNKVYFVTHDQIACAYALAMGVNVIFINQKYAYVLKNQADDSSVTPEKRLLDAYTEISNDSTFQDLKKFLTDYAETRTKYLKTYDDFITNSLTELSKIITPKPVACDTSKTADLYSTCINKIFRNCVMYCHITILLPDSNDINDILTQEANPTDIKFLTNFNHAYNVAKSIYTQHRTIGSEHFKWIKSLEKSDSYQSASNWSWQYKQSGRIRTFFTSIASSAPPRSNDMYLFLSFIGSINDVIANKITGAFANYEMVINKTIVTDKTWDKALFVSNNNELIKQIRIFLARDVSTFDSEKLYFDKSYLDNAKSQDERDAAALYINDQKEITNIRPNGEPTLYWGHCDENVVSKENTLSIVQDNTNLIITQYEQNVNENNETKIINAAFKESSCDADSETVLTPAQNEALAQDNAPAALGGGHKGGFPSSVEAGGIKFQMIMDVSIQETSIPVLTAFLIYKYKTPEGQQMLTSMSHGNYSEDGNVSTSDNLQMGGGFDINDVKISDTSIAYHPLLPIYMIACGYNYNITPDLEGSLDYDVYIKYLGFLEKMTSVLTGYNYLSNVGQNKSKNIAKSYIIGLSLRELLFTLNRDEDGIQIICENGANSALNATIDEYQSFSLMSSMLSDYISGKILEDATEKAFGIQLLQSDVFKNFINVEVDIKSLLNKTLTQQEESISISALNQRSLDLIKKISDRIVKDRSSGSGNASQGISSSQLSTISMNTGRTNTPDTLSSLSSSLTSALTSPISVGKGGFLKTKKQKRKRTQKTKRRKNKRSNKKTKKKPRRRKQSKKEESINSSSS